MIVALVLPLAALLSMVACAALISLVGDVVDQRREPSRGLATFRALRRDLVALASTVGRMFQRR